MSQADAQTNDPTINATLSDPGPDPTSSPPFGSPRPRARFSVYLSQARKTPLLTHDQLIALTREAYLHRNGQMEVLSKFVPCVQALAQQYEHHRAHGLKFSGFTTGMLDQSLGARDAVLARNRVNGKSTFDDAIQDETLLGAHCSALCDLLDRLADSSNRSGARRLRADLSDAYLRLALRVDEFDRHVQLFKTATDRLRQFAASVGRVNPGSSIESALNLARGSTLNKLVKRLPREEQSAFLALASEALSLGYDTGLTVPEILDLRERFDRHETERRRCINSVVEANLLLAAREALRQRPDDDRLFDLCQEANHGLMIAADRFSYWRNLAFSTYAIFWIRQRLIRDRDQNMNPAFSIPCSVVTRIRKVLQARNKLAEQSDAPVTSERIARELNTSRQLVDDALLANYAPDELDYDSLDLPTLDPEDAFPDGDISEFRDVLCTALEVVAGPRRAMFEMLWGLFQERTHTLDEVSQHFGLSQAEVRRAERDVLRRLRSGPFSAQLRDFYAAI